MLKQHQKFLITSSDNRSTIADSYIDAINAVTTILQQNLSVTIQPVNNSDS